MKSLVEICDEISPPAVSASPQTAYRNSLRKKNGKIIGYTDKNGIHSYAVHMYTELFARKRFTAEKVLEIGVWTGGSLVVWRDYFSKAKIYGIDNIIPPVMPLVFEDRIIQITADAYSDEVINSIEGDFDIIIDDGPHSLDSMIISVQKYLPKLKSDGIFVIEDLKEPSWADILANHVPTWQRNNICLYDLRHIKNVSDDIAFVVDMEKK